MSFSEPHFKPAQYYRGKECYVAYYVLNPYSNTLVRKKIKLNHIRQAHERSRYANALIHSINDKLYDGWNPFLDDSGSGVSCPSLRSAVDKFMLLKSSSLRPDSLRCYRSYVSLFSSWLDDTGWSVKPVALFTSDMAARYMRFVESHSHLSGKTFNNYLRFQSTLFLYFADNGWIKDNPFGRIQRKRSDPKVRSVIPPVDRARILDYFRLSETPSFVWVMMLCYRLFVRPKEIMMLRIRDIDFAEGLLTVPSSVAKNHHSRTLAVPDDIMCFFRTLSGLDPSLYIFSSGYVPGTRMLYTRDVGRTWSVMRSALGLPDSYQFYSLKDTGITEMLEAGVPPKFVQELADHHSLEMTERYAHKSSAKKILEFNKLKF